MRLFPMLLCGLVCGTFGLAGCQQGGADTSSSGNRSSSATSKPSEVAVVNLQDVLERLNLDTELNQKLASRREELKQKVADLYSTLQSNYKDKEAEFGDEPTEEQKKQLQSLQFQLNLQFRQTQQQANSEVTEYRKDLVNRFREQVKPVAREVASQRGAEIVLARDEGVVLTYEASVDITDDVVARMLNSGAVPQIGISDSADPGPTSTPEE